MQIGRVEVLVKTDTYSIKPVGWLTRYPEARPFG
jgi:hypothetical protein